MAIQLNDGIQTNAPRFVDMRAGKLLSGRSIPYSSISEALTAIPVAYRCEGMEFKVKDSGLVKTYQFTENYATDGYLQTNPTKSKVSVADGQLIILPAETLITGFAYLGTGSPSLTIGTNDLDPTDLVPDWDTSISKGMAASYFCEEETTLYIAGLTGTQTLIIFYQ